MDESEDKNLSLFVTDKMPQESYVVRGGEDMSVF